MDIDGNTSPMRIGELAAALGLNTKTIRYYEDIGLLPPPRRTPAGYRLYGEADRERLQFILKARAIGLSLDEISDILTLRGEGQQPCEHVLRLLDQKVAAIDAHLRTLAEFRQELTGLRDEAAESVRTGGQVCAIIEHHRPGHDAERACSAVAPAPGQRLRRY
ncbi:MAG: heavy metal-responsive transcriptional regulator [Dehalococcoidia bacterium]